MTEREELIEIMEKLLVHSYDCNKEKCDCGMVKTADAILEWHKNKLQVGKTQNKYSDYNGGSVTPNKGRMK